MDKRALAKKVVATVVDFDMHNLFPPETWMEALQEAAKKDWEAQPRKTLRERSYGPMPLMIKPEYSGDFLEKLKKIPRIGANSTNLWDFSMPSEWLKHQEQPYPRDLAPETYELNKPDDWVGMQTIRDVYDRAWEPGEAPEVSEDVLMRPRDLPKSKDVRPSIHKLPIMSKAARVVQSFVKQNDPGPDAGVVVASFLAEIMPTWLELDNSNVRMAMMLKDLERSLITTKSKGTRPPSTSGVTVRLAKAEPRIGRWIFKTNSAGGINAPTLSKGFKKPYTTSFQFEPRKNVRDVNKLQVRVSCTCPSWLFWGAQYHAVMGDYVYGPVRPKFVAPVKRDPGGTFVACKHILACIPFVSRYKVLEIPVSVRKRLQKAPKLKVEPITEKIKIPEELKNLAQRPDIKLAVKNWNKMTAAKRKRFINSLDTADSVSFMAHRFPNTATEFVIPKLKEMARKGKRLEKEAAQEWLKIIT